MRADLNVLNTINRNLLWDNYTNIMNFVMSNYALLSISLPYVHFFVIMLGRIWTVRESLDHIYKMQME